MNAAQAGLYVDQVSVTWRSARLTGWPSMAISP